MTDKEQIADKGRGIEECLVLVMEKLSKQITKIQEEAIHMLLLTKSNLVIQSSEDLGHTSLVGHAREDQPCKQPPTCRLLPLILQDIAELEVTKLFATLLTEP